MVQIGNVNQKVEVFADLARKALNRHTAVIKVIEGTADTNAELLEYAELIFNTHLPRPQQK
jgi:hypothetical protein